MQPIFLERKWKRPNDVAPFPNIWHRFIAQNESGQTYKVRIQDMTSDQYNEVWDVYRKFFYPNDPVVNITEDEEHMAFEKLKFYHIVSQNVSVVAVLDNKDIKPSIVGCLLLVVMSKYDPPLPTFPGAATAKVARLYDIMRGNINMYEKLDAEFLLNEYGLVVKPDYRRFNIGTELLKTMERVGKSYHIPAAILTVGTAASQKLARKLGFTLLNEVKLSEYVAEIGARTSNIIQEGYLTFV